MKNGRPLASTRRVDRDDRRMIEAALHARFAEEPRHRVVRRMRRVHPLDRDLAPDLFVDREQDVAHATFSDQLAEPVPLTGADRQRHLPLARSDGCSVPGYGR